MLLKSLSRIRRPHTDSPPEVSIIVPCYNQAAVIADTLKSVQRQTYRHWRCIVVDDGSTDDTAQRVQAFVQKDRRFTYIRKQNGGVASARNLGIRLTGGEYIVPLDGDDKIHPDYLRRAIRHFRKQPDTALVYCQVKRFGAKKGKWRLPEYSYQRLRFENMIHNCAVYPRALYDRTSGYSEAMKHGFEDWEFYIRLLDSEAKVHRIDAPLFYYSISKRSRTTQQLSGGHERESLATIYRNNTDVYSDVVDDPITSFKTARQLFLPDVVRRYKRQRTRMHLGYLAVILLLAVQAFD